MRKGPQWSQTVYRTTRDMDTGEYIEYQRAVATMSRREQTMRLHTCRNIQTTLYFPNPYRVRGNVAWAVDTGASNFMMPTRENDGVLSTESVNCVLETVAGDTPVSEGALVQVPHIPEPQPVLRLENTPNCVSAGRLVEQQKWKLW